MSSRILIAVHGYEPLAWTTAACDAVAMWTRPAVRILAMMNVRTPAFTSLASFARRAYRAALDQRREEELLRLQVLIDQLMPPLPTSADVVYFEPRRRCLAAEIADHAKAWSADVVMLAPPVRGLRHWFWPGPVHRQLLNHLTCAVMITRIGARCDQTLMPRYPSIGEALRRIRAFART